MTVPDDGGPSMTAPDDAPWPPLTADVVFGNSESPVAVCTLTSRRLLPELAGRDEIAIAGRCHTENIGIERMVQNLVANPRLRYLILCGQETSHAVGQTVLSLHRNGLDEQHRVVGSTAPEPVLPNLGAAELRAFRERVVVVDMIGELDSGKILERAGALTTIEPPRMDADVASEPVSGEHTVEHVVATPDTAAEWEYDPAGYVVIALDRSNARLIVAHHDHQHRLLRTIEGTTALAISQTIARLGLATLPAHFAYLGRELMKAELALRYRLHFEQDVPLDLHRGA